MTFPSDATIVSAMSGGRPDTPAELAAPEASIGPIPEPYRALLLQYGPFRFDGDATVNTPEGDELPIFIFYGAQGKHTIPELMIGLKDLEKADYVPFARDEYGNPYAWSRKDGSIGYLDIEEGDVSYEIASSMQEFLDSITVDEDFEDD